MLSSNSLKLGEISIEIVKKKQIEFNSVAHSIIIEIENQQLDRLH